MQEPWQTLTYACFDPVRLERTPAFVVDLAALERNARVLGDVQQRAGCKVLLALKAFALWQTFPLLRRYLDGATASGLHEALLAHEHFGGELHVYCPAFKPHEVEQLCGIAHTLVFNSPGQWQRYREAVRTSSKLVECGLRVNHGYSEVDVALYDPCATGSRLGTPVADLTSELLEGLDGLHFHTMCEQGADVLERTLAAYEERCGHLFGGLKWLNFGGGHHITKPGYDVEKLIRLVREWKQRYGVELYLEPGEAAAIHTGVLVSEVLDIFRSAEVTVAVLDTSATAHMPDTLEMPYRAEIAGAGEPGQFPHAYRLGGLTCLAGDVIGDYTFPEPLRIGQRLCFLDMAHYTMVKTTSFNGVPHPDICLYDPADDSLRTVRRFTYADFRNRLG